MTGQDWTRKKASWLVVGLRETYSDDEPDYVLDDEEAEACAENALTEARAEERRAIEARLRELFKAWQRSDHMQLHAGEMTAQERRSVKAVLGAIECALADVLSAPPATEDDGWRSPKTAPQDGTRIRALVETELFMEEHIPAALMGGWKRCAEHDRIIGWKPAPPATERE